MLDVCGNDNPIKRMLVTRRDNLLTVIYEQQPERVDRPRCSPEVWELIRKSVLARDGHICQGCGTGAGLQVHHIQHVQHGGSDDPANLITLCDECHARIHPWLEAVDARG